MGLSLIATLKWKNIIMPLDENLTSGSYTAHSGGPSLPITVGANGQMGTMGLTTVESSLSAECECTDKTKPDDEKPHKIKEMAVDFKIHVRVMPAAQYISEVQRKWALDSEDDHYQDFDNYGTTTGTTVAKAYEKSILSRRGRKNDFHPQCGVEDGNLILARLGIFE